MGWIELQMVRLFSYVQKPRLQNNKKRTSSSHAIFWKQKTIYGGSNFNSNLFRVVWYKSWGQKLYHTTIENFKVKEWTDGEKTTSSNVNDAVYCSGARFENGHVVKNASKTWSWNVFVKKYTHIDK